MAHPVYTNILYHVEEEAETCSTPACISLCVFEFTVRKEVANKLNWTDR
jgi:hypothetical protein